MKNRIKKQSSDVETGAKKPNRKLIIAIAAVAVVALIAILVLILMPKTTLVKLEDGTYDRGAVITMYISDEVFNLDPQVPITDDSQL